MEQIPKEPETFTSLKQVRLYLADLEHIVQLMESHDLEVSISDEDYKYDSLDEIPEYRGNVIYNLVIKGQKKEHGQSISISFSRTRLDLSVYVKKEPLILLWHEIKAFLKGKIQWHQRIFNPFYWMWISIITYSIIVYSGFFIEFPFELQMKILIYLTPFVLALLLFSVYCRWLFPALYLDRRHKVLNFWQRNSDKIILSVVSALFGAFIFWLVNKIT